MTRQPAENTHKISHDDAETASAPMLQETYRTLIDQSLQGIAVIQGGSIVFANSAFMASSLGDSWRLPRPRLRLSVIFFAPTVTKPGAVSIMLLGRY